MGSPELRSPRPLTLRSAPTQSTSTALAAHFPGRHGGWQPVSGTDVSEPFSQVSRSPGLLT